jgi:hypothetical protein
MVPRTTFLIACLLPLASNADTLTGVVKQPEPPHLPSPSSVVTIRDVKTNLELGTSVTKLDGKYTFDVKRGTDVLIKAEGTDGHSSPGTATTRVSANPTTADVYLLPDFEASVDIWRVAGQTTARRNSGQFVFVAGHLKIEPLTRNKFDGFLEGAQSVNPQLVAAFKDKEKYYVAPQ